ncbi:MAG: ABC transporter permease [Deltaproteobacteria bacterium]|nr:ABC transporter permease [Deltaproteobacteria bacterium]
MRRVSRAIGPGLVVAFLAAAVIGPWVAPHAVTDVDLLREYAAPSLDHPLGTGDNGVDLLASLFAGARLAALVALLVVGTCAPLGALLGAAAGYAGGVLDAAFVRVTDVVQAFPSIVLNVAILALVARPGLGHLVAALCVNGWVLYARVARAQALALREREFVTAARALGQTPFLVVVRHVLPNLAGPLVVQATFGLGATILAESSLSFLGLGPGAEVSWGAVLDQGTGVLLRTPRVAVVAGAAIALTVLGFNLTGDWLRDRLDPRGRG